MYHYSSFKDGVRGSRGGFNSMHLTAHISLNMQDILTYFTPKKKLISMPTYKYMDYRCNTGNVEKTMGDK